MNKTIISADGRRLGRPDLRYDWPKVVIEYQGEEFHSSVAARRVDSVRFNGFGRDGWVVVEVWAENVNSDDARHALVRDVAPLLGFPHEELKLDECRPRFFSRRMLELAEIRTRRARARRLNEG